jgi:predicted nucleic acid-binding protein
LRQVLLDTNVVLDVLLDRKPHATASASIWAACETGIAKGFLAAQALTTVHYLVARERGAAAARGVVTSILRVLRVAPVDADTIQRALQLGWPDFVDAVTAAAAEATRCDWLITRDPAGFRSSPVTAVAPEAALPLLGGRSKGRC